MRKKTLALLLSLVLILNMIPLGTMATDGAPLGDLVCGQEVHVHGDSCRAAEPICGLAQTEGHGHTDACWEQTLNCASEEEPHTHEEGCYTRNLICGQEEVTAHSHSEACYPISCGKTEHQHTNDCYAAPETIATTETTVPETTVPETTVPETTVPETTVPETTVPETTEATVPETTVPETTEETVAETTELSLFEQLMAAETVEALRDILNDENNLDALLTLTETEVDSLEARVEQLHEEAPNEDAYASIQETLEALREELGYLKCTCGTETEEHDPDCPLFVTEDWDTFEEDFVVTLNGMGYTTLEEAVAAANEDTSGGTQTITLLKDVEITAAMTVTGNITIEGGNHQLTYGGGYAADIFIIEPTGTLTVNNLTIDGGFLGELDSKYLTPETYKYPTNRTDASTYPLTSTEGISTTGDIFTNKGKLYVNNSSIRNFLSMQGSGWGDGLIVKVRADDTYTMFDGVEITNCINSGSGTLFNNNRGANDGGDRATFIMKDSSVTYTMGSEYGAAIHCRDRSTFLTFTNSKFDFNCINVDLDTAFLYIRDADTTNPHSTANLTDVKVTNSLGGHDIVEVYGGATLTLDETAPGKTVIASIGYHYDDDIYAAGATINGGTITGDNSVSLGGNTYIGSNATIENPHITIGGTSTNEGTLIGDVRASSSTGSLTNTGTITGNVTASNVLSNSGEITGDINVADGGYLENTGDGTVEGTVRGDVKIDNVIIDVDTANGGYLEMSGGVTKIPEDVSVDFVTTDESGEKKVTTVTGPATIEGGYVILPPDAYIDGDKIAGDHELKVPIDSITKVEKDGDNDLILPDGTIYTINNTVIYGPVRFETDGSATVTNPETVTVVNEKVTVVGIAVVSETGEVRANKSAEITVGTFTVDMTDGSDYCVIDNVGETVTIHASADGEVRPTITVGDNIYTVIQGPVLIEDNQMVVPQGSTAMLADGTSVTLSGKKYEGPAYIDATGLIHFYIHLVPQHEGEEFDKGPHFTDDDQKVNLPKPIYGERKFLGWFEGETCSDGKDCALVADDKVYEKSMYLHAHWQEFYDLTIHSQNSSGQDENQSYLFKITGETTEMCVIVVGNGSRTIKNLPYGNYTVTQMNDWSWRYGDETAQTIVLGEKTTEVTFIHSRVNGHWLDGNAYKEG